MSIPSLFIKIIISQSKMRLLHIGNFIGLIKSEIAFMFNEYFVYIMTNKHHTVLYTGFSDDTHRRTIEHKDGLLKGFTKKYNVHKLVYFERHYDKDEALSREYLIKRWKRAWKIDLINSMNPEWRDLFDDFISD